MSLSQPGAGWNRGSAVVLLALLLAIGVGLHAVEAMIPFPVIPGAKPGLANIVTVVAVYTLGIKAALVLSAMRVVLGSLLAGTFLSVTFALALTGAILSAIVMGALVCTLRPSPTLTSLIGAAAHNIGQLTAFALISGTAKAYYYLPYLLFFSLPAGYFVGQVSRFTLNALKHGVKPRLGGHKPDIIWSAAVILLGLGLLLTAHRVAPGHANTLVVRNVSGARTSVVLKIPMRRPHVGEVQLHEVRGRLGVSVLEFNPEKGMRFISSPCPDKLCIGFGWVSRVGDMAACLPNEIILTAEGEE